MPADAKDAALSDQAYNGAEELAAINPILNIYSGDKFLTSKTELLAKLPRYLTSFEVDTVSLLPRHFPPQTKLYTYLYIHTHMYIRMYSTIVCGHEASVCVCKYVYINKQISIYLLVCVYIDICDKWLLISSFHLSFFVVSSFFRPFFPLIFAEAVGGQALLCWRQTNVR